MVALRGGVLGGRCVEEVARLVSAVGVKVQRGRDKVIGGEGARPDVAGRKELRDPGNIAAVIISATVRQLQDPTPQIGSGLGLGGWTRDFPEARGSARVGGQGFSGSDTESSAEA